MEVGAYLRVASAADALREVDIITAVCIDAGKTDIVGCHSLLGGISFLIVFGSHTITGRVLRVPANYKPVTDRSHLCVGINIFVIGQTTGSDNVSVSADYRIEGLGSRDVLAGTDSVGQKRRAVRKHG